MATENDPCALHDLTGCEVCHPVRANYRRADVPVAVPSGYFVEIQPGTGAYHHPDCYMATAEWDGANTAKLGKRIPRSPQEVRDLGLRPAQCCEPPILLR